MKNKIQNSYFLCLFFLDVKHATCNSKVPYVKRKKKTLELMLIKKIEIK